METTGSYVVEVDYGIAIDDLVHRDESIQLGIRDENWVESRYPRTGSGVSKIEIEIIDFGRGGITTPRAKIELKRAGFRPATLHEILFLLFENPEVPEEDAKLAIIANETYEDPDDDIYMVAPEAHRDQDSRRLGWEYFHKFHERPNFWPDHYLFPACITSA